MYLGAIASSFWRWVLPCALAAGRLLALAIGLNMSHTFPRVTLSACTTDLTIRLHTRLLERFFLNAFKTVPMVSLAYMEAGALSSAAPHVDCSSHSRGGGHVSRFTSCDPKSASYSAWTFYPTRQLYDFSINIAGNDQHLMFYDAATCASTVTTVNVLLWLHLSVPVSDA